MINKMEAQMISHYIVIGLGGALGAIARVELEKFLPAAILGIPVYILFVNVLGSLVMGLLAELMALQWSASDNMRYFLISGVLGGFTTFSAFSLECGLLLEKNAYFAAITYTALSVGLSLIAFFVGIKIIRLVV